MFDTLIRLHCHSRSKVIKILSGELLEKLYGCEINCMQMDKSVRFAHHARGCTIVATKICENVTIFQNVTIGANLKFNRMSRKWENVGNPIISRNCVICDGAKILGPVVIGEGTVVGAGAIITRDIPGNCVAYGINQFRPREVGYDLVFSTDMIRPEELIQTNVTLAEKFEREIGRSTAQGHTQSQH